jgi:hypothetical protein
MRIQVRRPTASNAADLVHRVISHDLGESSQFFVSKSSNDAPATRGMFSVGISGPSTVFLDANETEHGYEVRLGTNPVN